MKAPVQTPGMWLRSGGAANGMQRCRNALANCGLDPDAFGSYRDVKKSQGAAREELRNKARAERQKKEGGSEKRHCKPCTFRSGEGLNDKTCKCHWSPYGQKAADDDYEFLHANGESGHQAMDSLFRRQKGRDDPCANYPPAGSNSGTYGYETGKARCMEHYGGSSVEGTPHYLICREEEDFIAGLKPGPISQQKMQEQVGRSAVVAVTAGRVRYDPKTDTLQPGSIPKEAKATNDLVASKQAGAAEALDGKSQKTVSKSKSAALSKDEKTECIIADWKSSVPRMQAEAISEHGPGSKKGQQAAVDAYNKGKPKSEKVESWDKMTKKQQADAVAARQKELQAKKADTATQASASGAPSKDDCREYQANWLWQQQTQKGKIPPMQPQNPDAPQDFGNEGAGKKPGRTPR